MTGREAAERLHADGLTKLAAGERAAAVDALTSAAAADRSFAPAHLSLARALVGHGTVYQVTGALDAWLEARPEPAELARTLEGDDAFAPLARQPAFSDWLVQRGLKEAPPPKAKAKAKAKKRRGKRKKRARRKTRKKAAPAVEYPDL